MVNFKMNIVDVFIRGLLICVKVLPRQIELWEEEECWIIVFFFFFSKREGEKKRKEKKRRISRRTTKRFWVFGDWGFGRKGGEGGGTREKWSCEERKERDREEKRRREIGFNFKWKRERFFQISFPLFLSLSFLSFKLFNQRNKKINCNFFVKMIFSLPKNLRANFRGRERETKLKSK